MDNRGFGESKTRIVGAPKEYEILRLRLRMTGENWDGAGKRRILTVLLLGGVICDLDWLRFVVCRLG